MTGEWILEVAHNRVNTISPTVTLYDRFNTGSSVKVTSPTITINRVAASPSTCLQTTSYDELVDSENALSYSRTDTSMFALTFRYDPGQCDAALTYAVSLTFTPRSKRAPITYTCAFAYVDITCHTPLC